VDDDVRPALQLAVDVRQRRRDVCVDGDAEVPDRSSSVLEADPRCRLAFAEQSELGLLVLGQRGHDEIGPARPQGRQLGG
jgi:hypothetical protein